MIDKLIDLLVISAGPMLALVVYCHFMRQCEADEQAEEDEKQHSGLLEDNEA